VVISQKEETLPAQERTRERKPPEVRRQEILDAAARLFIRQGVGSTSMAQVAHAAGVAKGTSYLYFESKDQLLRELRDSYLRDWYERATALLTDPPIGEEWPQLERFVQSMYEFHSDKVELHHLLLSAEGAEDEITAHVRKRLGDFLTLGSERGAFLLPAGASTVDFIIHGLHGVLVDYLHAGRSADEFTSAATLVLNSLIRPDR
jgi:AcrR family transcriptional regulator